MNEQKSARLVCVDMDDRALCACTVHIATILMITLIIIYCTCTMHNIIVIITTHLHRCWKRCCMTASSCSSRQMSACCCTTVCCRACLLCSPPSLACSLSESAPAPEWDGASCDPNTSVLLVVDASSSCCKPSAEMLPNSGVAPCSGLASCK